MSLVCGTEVISLTCSQEMIFKKHECLFSFQNSEELGLSDTTQQVASMLLDGVGVPSCAAANKEGNIPIAVCS